MSENESLLNNEELENAREPPSFNHWPGVVAIVLMVGMGLGVIWILVIPHYIQQEIDKGMGYYSLDSLNITGIGNRKVFFEIQSRLRVIHDQNQQSITAHVGQNKLDIQLRNEGNDYKTILSLGTPEIYYSTDELNTIMSWQDSVTIKNIELISNLISDFSVNNSNSYSLQIISHPVVSIPGIPGSWKMNFIRTLDFKASSSLLNMSLLDDIIIKEYQMTTGTGDDGMPKVTIHANASIFNPEPILVPLLNASLEAEIYYLGHHVLDVGISNIFINPLNYTYPLPIVIQTVDWTALQELIVRYSEGENVSVNLKNFKWNTIETNLKWIEGFVYSLNFQLDLPKVVGVQNAIKKV